MRRGCKGDGTTLEAPVSAHLATHTTVIARLERATQYSRAFVAESSAKSERSGILGPPLSRGMTIVGVAAAVLRLALRT